MRHRFRLWVMYPVLFIAACPATAESDLSREQLAQRIYDLSHVKREFVWDEASGAFVNPYWTDVSTTEVFIKIDGCTAQFRFLEGTSEGPNVPTFEVDISMSSLDISPNPETGDLYAVAEQGQNWPPGAISDNTYIGIIYFVMTDGNIFEGKLRSLEFFPSDNPVPLHDRPMEVIEGNLVTYQMDGVKDEETVRQLVAAFQEYQQTYCLVGS